MDKILNILTADINISRNSDITPLTMIQVTEYLPVIILCCLIGLARYCYYDEEENKSTFHRIKKAFGTVASTGAVGVTTFLLMHATPASSEIAYGVTMLSALLTDKILKKVGLAK